MTAQLVPAPDRYYTPLVLGSAALGIAGSVAAAVSLSAAMPDPMPEPLAIAAPPLAATTTASSASTVAETEPDLPQDPVHWVFAAAGQRYVSLAVLENMPEHGKPRLVEGGEGSYTAIAKVAAADVPAEHLRMTRVRLDSGCVADVRDYAIVSSLSGDPDYAGNIGTKWTADNVLGMGQAVLAARITGCGDATYGRDADLRAIVPLTELHDDGLGREAISALLASDAAAETQKAWQADGGEGKWQDHSTITARVLRHPIYAQDTWVAVHASYSEGGCGGPNANVWGLFRVGKDGSLATVEARILDGLSSITHIIDIDNDGVPELIGHDWIGLDKLLVRADGTEVSRLSTPFYGCPC